MKQFSLKIMMDKPLHKLNKAFKKEKILIFNIIMSVIFLLINFLTQIE